MDSSTAPMNMDGQNPMIEDDIYSCSSAVSMTQLNSQNLNHQGFMNEFPALCMIQGEFINHLQWHPHLKYHEDNATSNALTHRSSHLDRVDDKDILMGRSYPVTDIDNQVHYMTTMPNFAASHATLLNTSGKETPAPSVCPQEVMETFVSNDYFDPRRSSLGTFGSHGYNERLGNLRSKRDLHNNVAEFSQRVHERTGLAPFKIVGDMDQNEWISAENTSMSSDYTSGSSKYSNELSPSLCISQSAVISATSFPEHRSEMNCTGLCNYSLSEKRMDSEQASCNTNNSSPNFNYQPVQLSCLSSGSKFLRAVQEILSELATYCFDNSGRGSCFSRSTGNSITFSCSSEDAERNYSSMDPVSSYDGDYLTVRGQEVQTRKNLLDLLQMVDDQYSQCLAEIHKVISAYHAVTELDPHIHARFALQTVDLLYKNLRERINTSVLALGARILEGGKKAEEISFEPSFIQKQWALQQLRRKDHQLWRPQRGLPERSVSVLRAWMFQNFLHPYPKDAEKHLLAVKSGLTRSQVSNWFINARVRLWKPMIDEMYSEMNRRKAHQNGKETESNRRNLISIDGHMFRMI